MADNKVQEEPRVPADFEQLAERYWGAWAEAVRRTAPGGDAQANAQAGMHAWQAAIDWWARQAHGNRVGVDDVLERFHAQVSAWFEQMQWIAGRFAGRDSTARDIAAAWRESLGALGQDPFRELFSTMRGSGLQGLDRWIEDASPYLDAALAEGKDWLGMPAFGFAREHQERLQQLVRAQMEYHKASSAYNALMFNASRSAFDIFEDKLAECAEPGRQIESPRALFDLWVDAAEEAYAEIALSSEFRRVYGELAGAQMRLRAGVQAQIEQVCRLFDLPTRSELDGAHRKIVELERAVRKLRDAVALEQKPAPAADAATPPRAAGAAAKKAAAKAARKVGGKAARPASKARKSPARRTADAPTAEEG